MDPDRQTKSKSPVDSGLISGSNFLFYGIVLVSFVMAYLPVWRGLIGAWSRSEEYSHGFFIVPVSLYVAWRKREVLEAMPLRPKNWGLVLALISLGLYLLSYVAEIRTVESVSMITVLIGSILYLFGQNHAKALAVPLFLLLFMIPVPAQIYAEATIPLQFLVSKVSVWTVVHLGLPIYREGNVIHLPGLTLEVVQACSGLRSMVSLLVLAAVFGYLTIKSNVLRAVLFASAIPISIVVNILRVMVLALAWNWLDSDLTKGTGHTLSGILVFVLALLLMLLVREILARWDIRPEKE
jgi:exosortase